MILTDIKFDTNQLIKEYKPVIFDKNKFIVFKLGLKKISNNSSIINYSRWSEEELPSTFQTSDLKLQLHQNYFDYPESTNDCIEWHLNFAHSDIFVAYGSELFAQDEMQVAEHPVLACLRESLINSNKYEDCLTVENNKATPILITGVERKCFIETNIDSSKDRPYGLYGNNFSRASENAIKFATHLINPPTISNIIAIESPPPETGKYTKQQIEFIIKNAITGFNAAVKKSKEMNKNAKVSIHTGYWGCGAYGGNRELMPLLQIIAAHISKIDILHFHTGNDNQGYFSALETFKDILHFDHEINFEKLLEILIDMNYEWGISDGN